MKTCWKELVQFSAIGEKLQSMYDKAVRVRLDRRTGRLIKWSRRSESNPRVGAGKRRRTSSRPTMGNLVYLDPSPNYCLQSNRRETLGTTGRECKADVGGHGSCTELCCMRGFLPTRVLVVERCQCKFHWCCEVRCKQCSSYQTKHFCL